MNNQKNRNAFSKDKEQNTDALKAIIKKNNIRNKILQKLLNGFTDSNKHTPRGKAQF